MPWRRHWPSATRGAGTVEFIVDADLKHYFLEMNTRLQVEHPVTECITGLDLVEWQLRVAAGEHLPLTQDEVRFQGHAIEVRLYAEDPYAGFAPQTGRVLHWRPGDALRPGVRIDSGIAEGGQVTPFYDAMVAKLIAHGRDRTDAIRRLTAAIEDAPLVGLRNNGRFLRDLLAHPAFREARMHTTLIDDWATQGEPLLVAPTISDSTWRLAAAVLATRDGGSRRPASVAAWDTHAAVGRRTSHPSSLATGAAHRHHRRRLDHHDRAWLMGRPPPSLCRPGRPARRRVRSGRRRAARRAGRHRRDAA